jgi:hypothetical protein
MSTELATKTTLPTVAELFADNLEQAFKHEQLNLLLNQEPKKEWVKEHPYIKGYKYLPIDKVEFMLRKIFKEFNIEVLREGQSFNGVYVVVRVHYKDPTTGIMRYHDGIGALELQLRAQTKEEKDAGIKVIFAVENINKGAISMAYPAAKTVAIKDACDHFGKLFGCDLNRKDTMNFTFDVGLLPPEEKQAIEETKRLTTHLTNMKAKGHEIDVILIEIGEDKHEQARQIWKTL